MNHSVQTGPRLPLRMILGMVAFLLLGAGLLWVGRHDVGLSTPGLPVLGQVPDFILTNQLGRSVSLQDLRGRVWIGDIIFTRCAGPCPQMTQRMSELQAALYSLPDFQLVTLTTDPEFDTPAVLKAYGERYGADPARWTFLSGAKVEIARLGIEGLKFTALEQAASDRTSPEDLFIHSTTFALVDRQGRLRAIFEPVGESVDFSQVKPRILAAVRRLSREP